MKAKMTLIENFLIMVVCIAVAVMLLRHVGITLADLSFPNHEKEKTVAITPKVQSEPATIENYILQDFEKFANIFKEFTNGNGSAGIAGYQVIYIPCIEEKTHEIQEVYDSHILTIWRLPMSRWEVENMVVSQFEKM